MKPFNRRKFTLTFSWLFILAALAGKGAFAQNAPNDTQRSYAPSDNGSEIRFAIRNMGFRVTGSFAGLQGSVRFDPANPATASFNITVDAATVNTDNSMRDEHLKASGYFDVSKYPHISFVSSKVTASNKRDTWMVTGQLTIRNHTKEISFPFTATPTNGGWLFKAAFTLNRRDFEVGGASIISDQLDAILNIFAK